MGGRVRSFGAPAAEHHKDHRSGAFDRGNKGGCSDDWFAGQETFVAVMFDLDLAPSFFFVCFCIITLYPSLWSFFLTLVLTIFWLFLFFIFSPKGITFLDISQSAGHTELQQTKLCFTFRSAIKKKKRKRKKTDKTNPLFPSVSKLCTWIVFCAVEVSFLNSFPLASLRKGPGF